MGRHLYSPDATDGPNAHSNRSACQVCGKDTYQDEKGASGPSCKRCPDDRPILRDDKTNPDEHKSQDQCQPKPFDGGAVFY